MVQVTQRQVTRDMRSVLLSLRPLHITETLGITKTRHMKFSTFILFLIITPSIIIAQEAWLSTPESITQFREQVESMKPETSQFDLMISNKTIQLTGRELEIRIYKPNETSLKPTLIYVHGACWVAGSLNSHDEICRYLSKQSGVNVIAINYRGTDKAHS